ncbi:VanZ family protein [Nostoc sp. UHCC 0251]|uniref:VanZ family protein n=1 Tax=Nostoc sp. UHCC 0251 TaxID=3110240 RepID=UPI002B1F3618|nr:VanZ family protein [Nostoc sp. UHCC 0251]MEA5625965.1 VanZ family protein [Nostoc sp. UHCC 0251]
MTLHKIFTQTSNLLSKLIPSMNWLLVITSVLAVLIATLYPFNFDFSGNLSIQAIISNFDNASSFEDLVNNILLFMPLGFSSNALLQKINIKPIRKFFTLIIISTSLSVTVEILQMFLPSRSPTPADIINNTIGGILGGICFYIWNSQSFIYILSSVENSRLKNSTKKISLLFLGYILLSFIVLIPWQITTNLSNWNLAYPLLIGNEKTGDKPWQGYITEIHIADKAFPENEVSQFFDGKKYLDIIGDHLIASYKLSDQRGYQDRTGQLPELLSQGHLTNIQDGKSVALSSSYWLKTGNPTTFLTKKIRKTSQFTIITTIATADTTQTGPARIISLSSGILRRNFTLGQQGNNLDLRIRTPITGENATDIKLSIPDIFIDTNFHDIVITYSQGNIQVYLDKLQKFYFFNLLQLIPKDQKAFYYALTFIPLGVCLTFLTILANKKLMFYRFLLLTGILLPSLIVESTLVIGSGKSISLTNILFGIFFTSGTMLILRLRASALVKKAALK